MQHSGNHNLRKIVVCEVWTTSETSFVLSRHGLVASFVTNTTTPSKEDAGTQLFFATYVTENTLQLNQVPGYFLSGKRLPMCSAGNRKLQIDA